jgi:hypothetical protein
MDGGRRRIGRWLVRTAALATVGVLGRPVPIAAQQAPPAVSASAEDGAITFVRACDGSEEVRPSAIVFFAVQFTDTPAPRVTVSWSGSLATDGGVEQYDGTIGGLPDQLEFVPGDGQVAVGMFPTRAGDLTMTIEPGAGYVLGEHPSATAQVPATVVTPTCPTSPPPLSATPHPSDPPAASSASPPAAEAVTASATYTG